MSIISSVVNFDDNLSKNPSYCNLLLGQMTGTCRDIKVCEHAALSSTDADAVLSKICEGYQFVIAFSGRLFNTAPIFEKLAAFGYRFTDHSDAELALYCYIHFGEESPGLLSGNFSYIIYDSMRRQIFSAVDNMASAPIFYALSPDGILISSHTDSILTHPLISAEITDAGAGNLICASGSAYDSILDGISLLPPCHTLKITSGGITTAKYCAGPDVSPQKMIRELISDNQKSVSMVYMGTEYDRQLLQQLAESNEGTRLTVYSCDYYDIFKELSAKWQKLSLCEESVLTSLEHTVCACGLPQACGGDFLLDGALRRFCSKNEQVFTAFSAKNNNMELLDTLVANNALHPAVAQTLSPQSSPLEISVNAPGLISAHYNIPVFSPFLRCAGDFPAPRAAGTALRHILLSIISKDTSPILAFFRAGALLRLCEGGFDFPGNELSESRLISYLIKLNIWLEKYRPIIR